MVLIIHRTINGRDIQNLFQGYSPLKTKICDWHVNRPLRLSKGLDQSILTATGKEAVDYPLIVADQTLHLV